MAEVKKIEHGGKSIFISVHKGLHGDEIIKNQERMLEMIQNEGIDNALTITDMRGVYVTPQVDKGLRVVGKDLMTLSDKAAIVGMATGIKKAIIYTFLKFESKPMNLFDTVEEALEWLVED
jgi:hypothetical protein